MVDHGLFEFVGVALRLAVEDTEEAVGDGGWRAKCQDWSSCRFTMDMVC
jgi:hypothetical protein